MNVKKLTYFIGISTILAMVGDSIFVAFCYQFITNRGLDVSDLSIMMAIGTITLIFADFPSGNISDIIGRKKTAAIGRLIWGSGLITFSLSTELYQFIIAVCIINIGAALNSGSIASWAHDYLISHNNENLWESIIAKISVSANFVNFALNIILMFVFYAYNSNAIFYSGLLFICSSFLVFFGYRKDDNYGARDTSLFKSITANIKYIFKTSNIRKITVIEMLDALILPTLLLALPFKLLNDIGMNLDFLPFTYIFLGFFILIGSIIFKKLSENHQVEKIYRFNFITFGIAISTFLITKNIIVIIIATFIYQVAVSFNGTSKNIWRYKYYDSHNKASMTSAVSACGSITYALAFVVVGFLLELGTLGIYALIFANVIALAIKYHTFDTLEKNRA